MTVSEIREKILTDDEFVMSETKKLRYARKLKEVIRYDLERDDHDFTESVAEHTHTMQVIADYFLRLEPKAASLDWLKVKTMITWHDMDEIETGDTVSWKKSPEDIAAERVAWKATVIHLPEILIEDISSIVDEYEALESGEAKFVKAIDKLDPLFYIHSDNGKKWMRERDLDFTTSEQHKIKHIEPFPIMKRFMDVIHAKMIEENFFKD